MRALTLFILLIVNNGSRSGAGDDWPRWRGPDGTAVADGRPLPLRWGPAENILWKTAIPGAGFSSPIIAGDRVFLTAAQDRGARRLVYCLDRKTGRILWSRAVVDDNPEPTSAVTGHAAATPVTDGQRVVAFFGNAGVVCYDRDGKKLWRRALGEFATELGLASSPILYDGRVILVCDHDGDRFSSFDSFLAALDLKTGKECWRTQRRGLLRSWSTPLIIPGVGGRPELIVSGQEAVRAYDPRTGNALWQVRGLTPWVAPSPVFGHGMLFAVSGKNGPIQAIRPGGAGDVTGTRLAWQHKTGGPYVGSPVLYGPYLYVPGDPGLLRCYNARTGKLQYQERLGGKFTASPVAGDGKVYYTNEDGTTFVIRAGARFAVLARNALGEYCQASPALAAGQVFLRTEKHLYCIGKER